jgi:hypothetical protein
MEHFIKCEIAKTKLAHEVIGIDVRDLRGKTGGDRIRRPGDGLTLIDQSVEACNA